MVRIFASIEIERWKRFNHSSRVPSQEALYGAIFSMHKEVKTDMYRWKKPVSLLLAAMVLALLLPALALAADFSASGLTLDTEPQRRYNNINLLNR